MTIHGEDYYIFNSGSRKQILKIESPIDNVYFNSKKPYSVILEKNETEY